MVFHKYQGAGNDFLIADNRDGSILHEDGVLKFRDDEGNERCLEIEKICDRRYGVGADGLMLLERSDDYDFRMVYFNSDGSGGMMCGNGGRCIVAFAADCGIINFHFEAADGEHQAEILSYGNGGKDGTDGGDGCDGGDGRTDRNGHCMNASKTVRLKMKDVSEFAEYQKLTGVDVPSEGYFLDTGTRHFVRIVSSLEAFPVVAHGREIRYNGAELQPVGANVNFVELVPDGVKVRTYEKGVEDETFACGTGIVASCLAAYLHGHRPCQNIESVRVRFEVQAKRDALAVDFIPSPDGRSFSDIWLTGPATYVADILL